MPRPTSIHSAWASESPSRGTRGLSEGGEPWLAAFVLLAAIALPLSWPGTGHAQDGAFPADALQKLLAADGAINDVFGGSVAISGDRAIVGAWGDDDNGDRSGAAYVFERAAGGRWREVAKLAPVDGAAVDFFGFSVAILGDRAIVGAHRNDGNGRNSGAAYVFERAAGGTWSEVVKLIAADAVAFDQFGVSVALSGDRAIVGALANRGNKFKSGSAYVFERAAGGGWSQVAKLTAADGAALDDFGNSVALSGDRAIVGAYLDYDNGSRSGSAYVFERAAGGGWSEVAKLTAADGADRDYFGGSVALSGDRAIVGVSGDDDNGFSSGSAYVFERAAGGTWSEVAKLIAADGKDGDQFGASVALSGDQAIVGAVGDDNDDINTGSAYMFDFATLRCNGFPVTVDLNRGDTPTSGDDVIFGTPAGDTINAMDGNDTVCGKGGADVIYAGGGNDLIYAGGGDDRVAGGPGDDVIYAGRGYDWVAGGPGDDVIRGGFGDDELRGRAGDDTIMGNLGDDRIFGGAGVDEIDGGAGNDILFPGPGGTVGSGFSVKGGGGNDIVYGGPNADDIRGNNGDDRLYGKGGGDRINGGPKEDWISGGSGADVLNGGRGDDVVQGGAGDDVVRGDLGDDAVLGGEGTDRVEGGGGDDVLIGGGSSGDVCWGMAGVDVATSSCERTSGVP